MRTEHNILQHELIGLPCEITNAKNTSQIGIKGIIINETLKTVLIRTGDKRKTIEKKGTTLLLDLNNKKIEIDGNYIVARPEDRIKKKIEKW